MIQIKVFVFVIDIDECFSFTTALFNATFTNSTVEQDGEYSYNYFHMLL